MGSTRRGGRKVRSAPLPNPPEAGRALLPASQAPGWLTRIGDRLAVYASAVGVERGARLAAVAVLPVLLPESRPQPLTTAVVGLSLYVLVTAMAPRNQFLRAADLLVAAGVIALAGPQVVTFLPFLLVTVAGPAARGGLRAGLAAGGTLSSVLLLRLVLMEEAGTAALGDVVSTAALLLVGGVTSATSAQVLADRAVHDRLVLQEANRLLAALRAIADDIPGGLDVATVSAALVAEVRAVVGTRAVVVYVEERAGMEPVASWGIEVSAPRLRMDQARDLLAARAPAPPEGLPAPLSGAVTGERWAAFPLGPTSAPAGLLLVGLDDLEAFRAARERLTSLAADGALALDNARLFDGTRARAAEAARRRVAGDLHDGVAQSLTHLRMELELMAMAGGEDGDPEVARLARVAESALTDLRATMAGLHQPIAGDLADQLERSVDDLRSEHGPVIDIACSGRTPLDGARGAEVLRIAQEAISNAIRHASASTIRVRLDRDERQLVLTVEDDGLGRTTPSQRPGGGVGLRSMRERAARLDGELTITDRPGGGTNVTLRCPITAVPTTIAEG